MLLYTNEITIFIFHALYNAFNIFRMFSLVKFDNGEYSILSTKRVKMLEGNNCRYIGGAKYKANLLDSSGINYH